MVKLQGSWAPHVTCFVPPRTNLPVSIPRRGTVTQPVDFQVSFPELSPFPGRRDVPRLHQASNTHDQYETERDNNVVVAFAEFIGKTLTQPVPGITPSFATGYVLVLLATPLFLSLTTSVLLGALFVLYSTMGRQGVLLAGDEVLDDVSRPPTDFLALGAATITAGLLTPIFSDGTAMDWVQEHPSIGMPLEALWGVLLAATLLSAFWTTAGGDADNMPW